MERVPVAIIGGGQAGLATSYLLRQRGIDHLVLEAGARIGASWRNRWDSLRLFTPARYDGLPGMRFPAPANSFPTKDEMADYLESYAANFSLPVRLGASVTSISHATQSFRLDTGDGSLEADQVVIASGPYRKPRVPPFACELDRSITQLHAGEYRNPQQLSRGSVLVVGAGNSGAEIAIEAAQAGHATFLAGRATGQVPPAAYALNGRIFWFVANRVLSVNTPIGRKARPQVLAHGGPLIRLSMDEVIRAGVTRTPRVVEVKAGAPVDEEGRTLEVQNVVWCTGFSPDFSWIHLPIFDAKGQPTHDRGVVGGQPGLYFIGLPFLTKLASAFVGGVAGDAKRLADVITSATGQSSRAVSSASRRALLESFQ